MNIKQILKIFSRVPSSDSVVVSDIKNMMAKTVCFKETAIAVRRFMLSIVVKLSLRSYAFQLEFENLMKK
jgi:hypothetical protein